MATRKEGSKRSPKDGPSPSDSGEESSATVNGRAKTSQDGGATASEEGSAKASGERYRPLPTGMHGLDPEVVKNDQRERLRHAMVELIAEKGYARVRIVDLAKLARVSQPTFYSLFGDKEELFVSAYDEIAGRTYRSVLEAYGKDDSGDDRLLVALRAYTQLAAAEPQAMSLLVLGAF